MVPVLCVGEEDGTLFIAMRFIRGRDLGAIIAEQGRLDVMRATRIVDQVADALDSAHEWQASVSHIRPQLRASTRQQRCRVVVSLLLGCDASIGREWGAASGFRPIRRRRGEPEHDVGPTWLGERALVR